MRALILIAAIILLMALVGWVTFGTAPGRSSINLETEQIRHDTRQALNPAPTRYTRPKTPCGLMTLRWNQPTQIRAIAAQVSERRVGCGNRKRGSPATLESQIA